MPAIIETLQNAQDMIHARYEVTDIDTPATTEDDYELRTKLINYKISQWENEGIQIGGWAELFTNLTAAADGTKTTTAGTTAYAAPTDFRYPVGYLFVKDSNNVRRKFRYIKQKDVQILQDDTTTRYYYVTGSRRAGFTINIKNGALLTGETIEYEYYKHATALAAAADKFEMSDPMYAVEGVLEMLFEGDDEADRSNKGMVRSEAILSMMKAANEMVPFYQENRVDESHPHSFSGFGL